MIIHDLPELRTLILENPDLPIAVLAGEYANSGDCGYEYCHNVNCRIEEILEGTLPFDNGGYVFDDRIEFEERLADYLSKTPEGKKCSDEEFEALLKRELATYEPCWIKVIAIYADND